MSLIYDKLGTIKFLTNSSLNSISSEVNRNFDAIKEAFYEFLTNLKYDESLNSASLSHALVTNLNIREQISVGTVDSPDNVTIDANGRITSNSFLVEIAEAERVRMKSFTGDLNVAGIPGEMVYVEPSPSNIEGFYGYFQDFGWVRFTSSGSGGGSGIENLFELHDVHLANLQDGNPLVFDSATNKWINAPYNLSDFLSNLSNLAQYKIPYWNSTSLSNSNMDFNPNTNTINVNGDFTATTKSFVIDHPSKKGYKLRYGNLEGPEHGIYFRGRSTEKKVVLPDYWKDLVDINSITVTVTPIGRNCSLFVKEITSEYIIIAGTRKFDYFYTVFAERKDVPNLIIEYKK